MLQRTRQPHEEPAGRGTIWVVTELYWPETTSTGWFLTGIAEALAQVARVRVLCAQPTYSARGVTAPWQEHRAGVEIERVRSGRFDKDRITGRLVNLATFSAGVSARLLRELGPHDVVIAVTNPPALPYLTLAAARRRGARFVLLMHDVYPDVLVATGMSRARSPLVRLWRRASRLLYRGADRVVVLGRDMAARIPAERTVIIPNWGDAEEIRPDPLAGARVREELGLADRFVVQFMGNIGRTHGIDVLLEAARRLQHDRHFHFLFVGWGGRREQVERAIREGGLTNVSLRPPCSRAELPGYLNAADLATIAFVPGMAGVSVPSRMYNVMAAGRPLLAIADDDSELVRVVREEGCGFVAAPGDPDGVVAAIEQAHARRHELEAMGLRGRAAVQRKYSRSEVGRQWQELILQLDGARVGASPEASAPRPPIASPGASP